MELDNVQIEACARAAHEVNRVYSQLKGDTSHTHWEDASDSQRRSARLGVIGALEGKSPKESHEAWVAERVAAGWHYGTVKSEERREHPCLVPYEQLPPEDRVKDELYIAVVKAMASALWRIPNQ